VTIWTCLKSRQDGSPNFSVTTWRRSEWGQARSFWRRSAATRCRLSLWTSRAHWQNCQCCQHHWGAHSLPESLKVKTRWRGPGPGGFTGITRLFTPPPRGD
jgi:hypothetical protein